MKKFLKISIIVLLSIVLLFVGIFAWLYQSTKGEYVVLPTVQFDTTLPSITIDSVTFHGETFGDSTNPVVVVVHGGPGNDYRYLLPIKDLADNYFVVFYDQRGSGLSPRVNPAELNLENSLADLKRIMDHYSPEKPVFLIGHSWGAMLSSGITAKYPERVARVVLAEPGLLNSEMAEKYKQSFQIKPSKELLKEGLIALFESFHIEERDGQERIDYLMAKISMLDLPDNPMKGYFCNGDAGSGHLPFWRMSAASSMHIQQDAMKDSVVDIDLISGIEHYPDTVLFITGECNSIIGTEYQKGHTKHFPRVIHREISGAGHTMFGEKPDQTLLEVRHYFESVRRAVLNQNTPFDE